MATILQLENVDVSTTIDLTNAAGVDVIANDLERELSYTAPDGLITRTYTFRATGANKAAARENTNNFVSLIRQAITWSEDDMESESIFLREAADGETPTRMLVKGFEARGVTRMTGTDPFQSSKIDVYFRVAFTLQNHREEPEKDEVPITNATVDPTSAVGRFYNLSRGDTSDVIHTKSSRLSCVVQSFTASPDPITRVWVGLMRNRWNGAPLHIWRTHLGTLGTDASLGTDAGKTYGTNTVDVSFSSDEGLVSRVNVSLYQIYAAVGQEGTEARARGVFLPLLRYKVAGSGSVMARIGVQASGGGAATNALYNEARLLVSSGKWRFMPMGVIKLPPYGGRYEMEDGYSVPLDWINTYVDAQRLSGTATLSLDSITLIPYDHFAYVTDVEIYSDRRLAIVTNEDFVKSAFSFLPVQEGVPITSIARVSEQHDFALPAATYCVNNTYYAVVAGETEDEQVYDRHIGLSDVNIYPAWEAFSG